MSRGTYRRLFLPVLLAVGLLAMLVPSAGAATLPGPGIVPPFPSRQGCTITGGWANGGAQSAHFELYSNTSGTTYCNVRVAILCGTYPNSGTYYWNGWSAWHAVGNVYGGSQFVQFWSNPCDGVRVLLNVDVEVDNIEIGNKLNWNQNAQGWGYNGAVGPIPY